MAKRKRVEIMVEILDLCFYPQLRTDIVHGANLNWMMLQKYLPELQSQELLEEAEANTYVTTKKGHEFMEKWKEQKKIIHSTP